MVRDQRKRQRFIYDQMDCLSKTILINENNKHITWAFKCSSNRVSAVKYQLTNGVNAEGKLFIIFLKYFLTKVAMYTIML